MSKSIETQIISEWYDALEAYNVKVPPLATTLLQSVLLEFNLRRQDRDIWQDFLTKNLDELYQWYMTLNDDERAIVDRGRAESWRQAQKSKREILQG